MNLHCIVVDDEPLARKGMEEYLADVPYLKHSGSFAHATEAASFLTRHPVDLILLDIHMPGVTGIDFLKTLKNPPLVILTTAFPQYALESYDLNVLDYLVKPISFERFSKATQKALDYFLWKHQQTAPEHFFIKSNLKIEKINFSEVLFVEAMQNYCIIHTSGRRLICYSTLTAMQKKLPADRFMKVHKSFIVALAKVTGMDGGTLRIEKNSIPVSRTLRQLVTQKIIGNNLLKR